MPQSKRDRQRAGRVEVHEKKCDAPWAGEFPLDRPDEDWDEAAQTILLASLRAGRGG